MKVSESTVIIGGAPCSGKTTLASLLAMDGKKKIAHLDDLREEFQQTHIAERKQFPWIYSSFGVTAEEFWNSRTPADALEVEIQQAKEFWPTVRAIIDSGEYGIIEGVQLLPELIHRDYGSAIQAVFLIDGDQSRVEQTIQTRGLWGAAETYADWVKPLECAWVQLHNSWVEKEAEKFGFPVVKIHDRSTVLTEVMEKLQMNTL